MHATGFRRYEAKLAGRTPEAGEGGLRLCILGLQLLLDLTKLLIKDFWGCLFR